MFGLLHQYLVENRSLPLRGTGKLQLVRQPASFDVVHQEMVAPHHAIQFDGSAEEESAQPLLAFIARQLNIAEEKAYMLYSNFCRHLEDSLQVHHQFHWENVGTFKKDDEGHTAFIPDRALAGYNETVKANRVLRKSDVHPITVGSMETTNTAMREMLVEEEPVANKRWWIGALILGLTAIALILLRKYQVL